MSRPLRVEYPGALYHITSRGIDRREIYRDNKDREHFVDLLQEGADFYRTEVICYVLMSNHFHFLLRTKEANLSRFMQRLSVAYTRYYNHKYRRVGPLLQGRYKAIVVGSDEYCKVLSRYIHLNPVKTKHLNGQSGSAGVKKLEEYRWSSYPSVLDPKKRSKYFHTAEVLLHTGGDTRKGRNAYRKYVEESLHKGLANPIREARYQLVLGADSFVEWVKEKFIKGKNMNQYPAAREAKGEKSIDEIAGAVSKIYKVDAHDLLQKKCKHAAARNIVIELAYRANMHAKSLAEIGGESGGISGSAVGYVHKRMGERLRKDPELNKIFIEAGAKLSILQT